MYLLVELLRDVFLLFILAPFIHGRSKAGRADFQCQHSDVRPDSTEPSRMGEEGEGLGNWEGDCLLDTPTNDFHWGGLHTTRAGHPTIPSIHPIHPSSSHPSHSSHPSPLAKPSAVNRLQRRRPECVQSLHKYFSHKHLMVHHVGRLFVRAFCPPAKSHYYRA